MKNSNIIISVIIVLCIAGAVTGYGLTNPNDNVFTNLAGFTPTEDSATEAGDQGSGDGGSGDNGPVKVGSNKGGSSSNSGSTSGVSSSQAKNIVDTNHISQEGCYAGEPTLTNGNWYVPVLDKDGNTVDTIEIDSKTGKCIGRI